MPLSWWLWLLLGFLLFALELATPGGFFVVFFGVGAVVVALLAALDIAGPAWLQCALFGVVSLASLLLFRSRSRPASPDRPAARWTASSVRQPFPWTRSACGKWAASSCGGPSGPPATPGKQPSPPASAALVERVDGLTLHIRG